MVLLFHRMQKLKETLFRGTNPTFGLHSKEKKLLAGFAASAALLSSVIV